MIFLKNGEVQLEAGYLTSGDNKPVFHAAFVEAQQKAHYMITLAARVKDANFKPCKVDNFDTIANEVLASIKTENTSYVYKPVVACSEGTLQTQLKEEAMMWVNCQKENSVAEKINSTMQQFNVLKDFEEAGLYFEEKVVKLSKLYSVAEVLAAITVLNPHLD